MPILVLIGLGSGCDNSKVVLEYCDNFYEWEKVKWDEVSVPTSASVDQISWEASDVEAMPWLQEVDQVSIEIAEHPKLHPIEMTSSNPECPDLLIVPLAVSVQAGEIRIEDDGRDDKRWGSGDLPPWQKTEFTRVVIREGVPRLEVYAAPHRIEDLEAPEPVLSSLPKHDGFGDPVLVLTAAMEEDGTCDLGFASLSYAEQGNAEIRTVVG